MSPQHAECVRRYLADASKALLDVEALTANGVDHTIHDGVRKLRAEIQALSRREMTDAEQRR